MPDAAIVEQLAGARQVVRMSYERARWEGVIGVMTDADHRITAITATRCGLTELPAALGELERLERLDVSRNDLYELPGSLAALVRLRELYLYDNLALTELPALGALERLQVLDANRCSLGELPAIERLHELEYLYLEANGIAALPALPETLRYLNVNGTRLRSLEAVRDLSGLVELRADHTPLQDTLDLGGLPKLRELYLAGHGYIELPPLPPALEVLGLRDNICTEIPASIAGHPSLSRIDLRGNFIDTVPAFVAELPRLRRLDLRWNRLRAPRDWLAALVARDVLVYT